MGCIRPDGSLTLVARDVIQTLIQPRTEEEVQDLSRQPMYRVRASLRELVEAGLVEHEGDRYRMTDAGRSRLQRA